MGLLMLVMFVATLKGAREVDAGSWAPVIDGQRYSGRRQRGFCQQTEQKELRQRLENRLIIVSSLRSTNAGAPQPCTSPSAQSPRRFVLLLLAH